MCGIAGIWGDVDPARLRAMGDALRHRGPDDDGFWTCRTSGIGFAHRRLSIIDVSGGHQPMANEDESVVVVFNGAIYNHVELRESLERLGHRFTTASDTETILRGFAEHGVAIFAELRGMFAVAIWDQLERRLILARDPVGKKPLYFAEVEGEFLFASEIKGVRRGLRAAPSLSGPALDAYLTWGCVPGPGTIYREIYTVQPGEVVEVVDRKIAHRKRYWRQALRPITPMSREQAVERSDGLLREAVRLRLRADVDVGCFLSGGIDSGLIVAMASSLYAGTLKTITVGFEDGAFDERPLAAEVASRYGTSHSEVTVRPDIAGDLAAIARAYDQPYADSSAIPSYYVAKAAREHVKVVLNGDGGDEVFAGYRRYVAALVSDMIVGGDSSKIQSLWAGLASMLPSRSGHRTPYAFLRRFARGMGRGRLDRYVAWALDGLDASARGRWLGSTGGSAAIEAFDMRAYFASLGLGFEPGEGFLTQMMAADFACVLPYDLLVKVDIACMAHGLEARSPLLDVRLIDAVSSLPTRTKLSNRVTKPILRELARRYLPDRVCDAPKRGFEIPLTRWLNGELRALSEDVLLSRSGMVCELFGRRAMEKLLRSPDDMVSGGLEPDRRARFIWILLMLGLWDQCVRGAD